MLKLIKKFTSIQKYTIFFLLIVFGSFKKIRNKNVLQNFIYSFIKEEKRKLFHLLLKMIKFSYKNVIAC